MALEKKVLIVVDPTLDAQPAVDRVIALVEKGPTDYKPEIALLVTADLNNIDSDSPGITMDGHALQQLAARLDSVGITPELVISWSKDWSDVILHTAEEVGASSLMLSNPGTGTSTAMTIEFWKLIRNTHIPVGIIQNSAEHKCEKILASINIQDRSEGRQALNRRIGETGRMLAQSYGAQFHIANAYGSSSSYPDRGRLVSETGIPNENIHLAGGEPEEGLAEITRELDPDMIIVGATRRRGIKAALRSLKMSRIFQAVNKDFIIVV